jgi:hypothetical protein
MQTKDEGAAGLEGEFPESSRDCNTLYLLLYPFLNKGYNTHGQAFPGQFDGTARRRARIS